MKINITYPILLLMLLFGIQSQAQWDTTWIKTYGGNRDDHAYDVIKTNDHGFLVIGSTSSFGFDNSQMYFLKLDSVGGIMWSKSHGGAGQESGHSVIQTTDGGFLGVGYTNSTGMGGFDLFLVKLDQYGNQEYEDTYGGLDWDFAWDVHESTAGEYLIAGETQSFGNGGKDGWIVKYSEVSQSVLWHKTVGTTEEEYFKALALDSSGNIVAAGGGFKPNRTDEDVMATMFNASGDTVWTKFYGDTLQDYANDVVWMKNSKITFTGAYSIPGDTITTNLTQIDTNGNVLDFYPWSQSLKKEIGNKIIEIDSNRLAILGTVTKDDNNSDMRFGYTYPNSLFYEEGGNLGEDFQENGEAIAYLGDQGYVFTGFSNGYNSSFTDVLLFKTNKFGYTYDFHTYEKNGDTVNVTSVNSTSNFQIAKYDTYSECVFILNQKTPTKFHIYNLYGVEVSSGTLLEGNQICLNQITNISGIYFVQLTDANKSSRIVLKIYKR